MDGRKADLPPSEIHALMKVNLLRIHAHKMLTEIREQGVKPNTIGYQMYALKLEERGGSFTEWMPDWARRLTNSVV